MSSAIWDLLSGRATGSLSQWQTYSENLEGYRPGESEEVSNKTLLYFYQSSYQSFCLSHQIW